MSKLETRRFDGKLDSFLRRNLPSVDYERICTFEPCVAVSPEEKRVHRHVVLGHRCLYLTEFPPKGIKVAANLQDVQSVCMLDDLPEFLRGKEREETIHIQIHYRRAVKERSLLEALGEKSPAILKEKLTRNKPRRTSSPLPARAVSGSQALEGHMSTPTVNSFIRSHSTHTFPTTSQSNTMRIPQQQDQQERSRSLSPISYQISPNQSFANGLNTLNTPMHKHRRSAVEGSFTSQQKAVVEMSPLAHPTNNGLKSAAHRRLAASSSSINTCSTSSGPEFNKSTKVVPMVTQNHSKSPPFRDHSTSPDMFLSTLSLDSAKSLMSGSLSVASTDRLSSSAASGSSIEQKTEMAVLDLYILKQNTDFYHQLCAVWKDFNIAHTLGTCPPKPCKTSSLSHEHFSQHYCTLKQELLATKSIETGAQLAHELCTACQKYWIIKRFFWEDSELFEFCTEQLNSHLFPKGKRISCARADEMEYSIILMDLLYQMLRETHLFPRRLAILTRNGGQLLLALATTVVDLLPKHKSTGFQVAGFDGELTEKSCGILFELVRVTQQARWPQAGTSSVCVNWLVETLSTLPNIHNYCSRLVGYACSVLSGGSEMLGVESQHLVTLHHAAALLETFVQNSSVLVQLLRSHLMEEFRYFISISRAKQTLPESSPLSQRTLEFLQSAKSKILQGSRYMQTVQEIAEGEVVLQWTRSGKQMV